MKFVYVTDLHGDEGKYQKALDFCIAEGATMLHAGADLLPKGYSIQPRQKDFIKKFLPQFIKQCSDNGIQFLAMFGNDDLWTRKDLYRQRCGALADDDPVDVEGIVFTAYPYVPDYPFGLKTACKYDFEGWLPEPYISVPVEITEEGFKPIADIKQYFLDKGTIENDLRERKAQSNEIVAIHSPPSSVGLDMCFGGRAVGSHAIKEWIEREQPLMVLSGHLHENHWAGGKSVAHIGRTTIVQPGQYQSNATAHTSMQETPSEGDLIRWPFLAMDKLRAAIIDVISGKDPVVRVVDV